MVGVFRSLFYLMEIDPWEVCMISFLFYIHVQKDQILEPSSIQCSINFCWIPVKESVLRQFCAYLENMIALKGVIYII